MYYHFLVETVPKLVLLQRHWEATSVAAAQHSAFSAASLGNATNATLLRNASPASAVMEDEVWDLLVWGQPYEARRACITQLCGAGHLHPTQPNI